MNVRLPRFALFAASAAVVALFVAPLVHAAQAQTTEVGREPEKSPYRDIESPQRITLFGGYMVAGKDAARAVPGNGALFGARYEVTVGGPAQFFVRAMRIGSTRTSYDPSLGAATRSLGKVNIPLYLADLGFSFNLTGQKSWHSLVPIAGFALGAINGSNKSTSRDPYRFGTQFAVSTEFGVRIVPGNSFDARITLGNTLYQTKYPTAYFTKASDNTSVVGEGTGKSSYRNNWMLTAGASYPIFR